MVTKESIRDKHTYVRTIGDTSNSLSADIPPEEVRRYRYESWLGVPLATISLQEEEVQQKPFVYERRGLEDVVFLGTVKGSREPVNLVLRLTEAHHTAGSIFKETRELLHGTVQEEIEIYPGYRVSFEEYERRFKGVALDRFRKVLPDNLFRAYVHGMGSIEGWGILPKDRYKGID